MNVDQYLKTSDGQEIAVYTRGNRSKPAVIFLHGGPGGQISEKSFSFFDLEQWFVIAFDQRGCGNSKPFATLENNTPMHGVLDIEMIREYYSIESWVVFGGSYGSTLALAYAINHPQRVTQLVLRGIFLGRDSDVRWLYQEGASYFYPHEHEVFRNIINDTERDDLVSAYYKIFTGNDDQRKRDAAKVWADWEGSVVNLVPDKQMMNAVITDADISLATLECHFFANKMFWNDDNYLLRHATKIADIPTYIVHGRYDVDCRLSSAYELVTHLNEATLTIAESSGHSSFEPNVFNALQEIMKNLEK